ncbi:polysaccharide pyruvyl transferase family protein [Anaerosporobacter sp.]
MFSFLGSKIAKHINLIKKYSDIPSSPFTIYLIGTEDLNNLGDHHIAISQLEFLKKYFSDCTIIEIPISTFGSELRYLKHKIKPNDILFCTGGGNCGDAYANSESIRHSIIESFPNNKITIFPQTIDFSDTDDGQTLLSKAKSIYSSPNVLFLTREKTSYNFAKNNFKCTTLLYPDIVLFSNHCNIHNLRQNALLCMRSDKEKSITTDNELAIKTSLKQRGYSYTYMDTTTAEDISINTRDEAINNIMKRLTSTKLVITDRLHGMVFSAITQTPCVVLSNYNHKVKGVYEWIKDLNYIEFVESNDDIINAIDTVTAVKSPRLNNNRLLNEFDAMARDIKEFIAM